MPNRFRTHAANALTAVRVLLTPAFVAAAGVADGASFHGAAAVAIFAVIVASDVWDGRLARRWDSASNGGRVFDHFADIGFIVSALFAYAWMGIAPWWVPTTIAACFGFYVVDSWSRTTARRNGLIGSRIGHAAGVLNYALVGVLVCNNTAGMHLLSEGVLRKLFWLVPVYSVLAVGTRLTGRRAAVPVARLLPSAK